MGLLTLLLTLFVAPLAGAAETAAAPTPQCTPEQCATLAKLDKACPAAAPWVCTEGPAVGGCFAQKADAPAACGVCYYGSCATPASSSKTRTITFTNRCDDAFAVYQDATEIIAKADFAKGATKSVTVTLEQGTNSWGKTFFYSDHGINFRALPTDQDLSNSTLFEVAFGAYDGTADVYDLSAIPPSSCAGHLQKTDNDYGYADHLPYKDPSDSQQSWACLKKSDGTVDPKTCGDGLGHQLCPAVAADPAVGNAATVQPPQASRSAPEVIYGCGVGKCCGPPKPGDPPGTCNPTSVTDCCPQVCAVTGTDDPTAPAVRDKVHLCAYEQSLLVAKKLKLMTKAGTTPRQTGFWKPMKVAAVGTVPASCRALSCAASSPGAALPDAASCGDGYLWPYDDLAATITCFAAPDYAVTFCG